MIEMTHFCEHVAFTPVYRKFVDEREPLFTSTIPVHRVVTGVCGPPARAHTRSSRGFSGVQSLDLDEPIALEGARIQADLRAAGDELAARDLLIAATARSTAAELVVADEDIERSRSTDDTTSPLTGSGSKCDCPPHS